MGATLPQHRCTCATISRFFASHRSGDRRGRGDTTKLGFRTARFAFAKRLCPSRSRRGATRPCDGRCFFCGFDWPHANRAQGRGRAVRDGHQRPVRADHGVDGRTRRLRSADSAETRTGGIAAARPARFPFQPRRNCARSAGRGACDPHPQPGSRSLVRTTHDADRRFLDRGCRSLRRGERAQPAGSDPVDGGGFGKRALLVPSGPHWVPATARCTGEGPRPSGRILAEEERRARANRKNGS